MRPAGPAPMMTTFGGAPRAVGGLTHGMQCTGGYGRTAEPSPTGGYGTQTPVNASTEYPTSPAADSTQDRLVDLPAAS